MNDDIKHVNCSACHAEVHPYNLFPDEICVGCYETRTANLSPSELFNQIQSVFNPKGKK